MSVETAPKEDALLACQRLRAAVNAVVAGDADGVPVGTKLLERALYWKSAVDNEEHRILNWAAAQPSVKIDTRLAAFIRHPDLTLQRWLSVYCDEVF